jgi:putative endonuclease
MTFFLVCFSIKRDCNYFCQKNFLIKPPGTHNYFVYITTNPGKSVLYTGVTNDLKIRIKEHQSNKGKKETFAGRYYCYKLIYFEHYSDINIAIEREKEIKDLSREKKFELIEKMNPNMNFLIYDEE